MPDIVDLLESALSKLLLVACTMLSAALFSCATDVQPDESFTVTITPYTVVLVGAGDTVRLNATLRDNAGEAVATSVVVWESSDPHIASVDQSGLVTAQAGGRFVISAVVEGLYGGRTGTVITVTGSGLESMDRSVASFMSRYDVPGMALAVAKNGRLVVARGYGFGDVANEEPVVPISLFRIASVGKSITGITVVKLHEDGRLDLDERVFDILADLWPDDPAEVGDERLRDITVRMLLHHGGGWDGDIYDAMWHAMRMADELGYKKPLTADTLIRLMIGQPLQFTPGTRYAYSNFGYVVLGSVIERIAGMEYHEHVRNSILAPLGVSRMQERSDELSDRAQAEVRYYGQDDAYDSTRQINYGWIASAVDLVRVMTAVDGIETPPDLLSNASRQLMGGPPPWWDGSSGYYAMGWDRDPGRWMHMGSTSGAMSWIEMRDYDGLAYAVLMNMNADGVDYDYSLHAPMFVEAVSAWPDHDLWPEFDNR